MQDYIRSNVVRIVPPGEDKPEHRRKEDKAIALTPIIKRAVQKMPHCDRLELLTIPGKNSLEYIFNPLPDDSTSKKLQNNIQLTLEEASITQSITPESTVDRLGKVAIGELQADFGVEKASIDLRPLGVSPVTTCRLVLEENRDMTQPDHTRHNPYAATIQKLEKSGKPYIVQTIVDGNTRATDYLVTFRVAVLHPDHTIISREDFIEHYQTGKNYDLSEIWHDIGLKSNYDIPITNFYQILSRMGIVVQKRANYKEYSDSDRARELFIGLIDYLDLFRGRASADELLTDILGHGRIPTNSVNLRHFGMMVPRYYSESPFSNAPGRSPFTIITEDIYQSATGTYQSISQGKSATPDDEESASGGPNQGSSGHAHLIEFGKQFFREHGDAVAEFEQEGSVPDFCRKTMECDWANHQSIDPLDFGDMTEALNQNIRDALPDASVDETSGTLILNEVEDENIGKPANTVVNAARALTGGHPCEFITSNKSDAASLFKRLHQPYKEKRGDGVVLFNNNSEVTFAGGIKPVLPEGVTESTWVLRAASRVELQDDDGNVLASGSPSDSSATFNFDTPRYEEIDGTHRIMSPEGQTIAEYPTEDQMKDEWTLIYKPCIPPRPCMLRNTRFLYKDGRAFSEYQNVPDWSKAHEQKTNQYRAAVVEFLEKLTIENEGGSIRYTEFQNIFKEWFGAFSAGTPPKSTYIGTALSDQEEFDINLDGRGVQDRHINDRTWIFPCGILSPDQPCVPAEDTEDTDSDDE
jgi:hypothetical protein